MFKMLEKNQCDHGHETYTQVRLLPYGGGGNIIVCKRHYIHEMAYRRDRNLNESDLLPEWKELKIYEYEIIR